MPRRLRLHAGRWTPCAVAALALVALVSPPAGAITTLFSEDFNDVPLTFSPTYNLPNVWSPNPPPGWEVENDLPGQVGLPEWEGWTFWRKPLWQNIGGGPRHAFDRGQDVIAIADNDLWSDAGEPDKRGLYTTFLQTPIIDLDARGDNDQRLVLRFDTSWFARECCDDGEGSDHEGLNNQTGIVRLRYTDGEVIELLRWEAARFRDEDGRPTDESVDPSGKPNDPNPFFQRLVANDRVFLDLSDLIDPAPFALLSQGEPIARGSSSGSAGAAQVEFVMGEGGDDGYWAVDNVELASFPAEMPGDLHIDGVLDAKDIDAFALGLLDETEYLDTWFGETPGSRGSPDSVFDYDDVPWFLSVMESAVPSPALALATALRSVPEPSTALLLAVSLACPLTRRRRRPA